MVKVDEIETIRRAYFIEGKSIREISREFGHCRRTVRKALKDPGPWKYRLQAERRQPVLGPYQERIDSLLEESDQQPRKQRFTARRIYQLICEDGYQGSESTVRRYVGKKRSATRRGDSYLPLEFDPGQDAQLDWTEAVVELKGKRQKVQLFIMRLPAQYAGQVTTPEPDSPWHSPSRSKRRSWRAMSGRFTSTAVCHVALPMTTSRRLCTASCRDAIVRSRRHSSPSALARIFESYYLFESRYCTPAQAHEKGGVESDAGYALRNFMAPVPEVNSYAELNERLRMACVADMHRRPRGKKRTVAELLEEERARLLPIPEQDYPACVSRPAKVNPYSQVVLDTNRYSVPAEYGRRQVVLRAFPFRIEVLWMDQVIARHERCFEREKDIIDPLHYVGLLSQRPGAFEHAIPVRRWRETWPPAYERLLEVLQERWPEGRGIREFIAILELHRKHSRQEMEQAIRMALDCGVPHLDGVELCLRQQASPKIKIEPINMRRHPALQGIGDQPVDLQQYERLVQRS
jgi:transposase